MGRCRCSGHVVFGTFAVPLADAAQLGCRVCGHEWPDNSERCTTGLTSDAQVAWCPKCGSTKTLVVTRKGEWYHTHHHRITEVQVQRLEERANAIPSAQPDAGEHCFREDNCSRHKGHKGSTCCCCDRLPEDHSGCDCED